MAQTFVPPKSFHRRLSGALIALAALALLAGALISRIGAPDAHLLPLDASAGVEGGVVPVMAQVDFTTQLVLREEGRTAFVLPLLALPESGTGRETVLGALVWPGLGTLDDARLDALLEATLAMGPHGPVVRLGVDSLDGAPFAGPLASALADQGRVLADGAPMFAPVAPVAASVPWAKLSLATAVGLALAGLGAGIRARTGLRREAQPVGTHHRVAPYLPAMANSDDGALALARVIAPSDPVADIPVARPRSPLRPARRPEAGTPKAPGAALFAAVRFGQGCAEDLKLSPRVVARLDADPFVRRLTRLN